MIGIDTNVLVRYVVRDNETQFNKASRLIKRQLDAGETIYLSLLVLMETEWVLRSRYGFSKEAFMGVLTGLLESTDVELEDESTLEETLYTWKDSRCEFADCLIGAHHRRQGCEGTATFDVQASRLDTYTLL